MELNEMRTRTDHLRRNESYYSADEQVKLCPMQKDIITVRPSFDSAHEDPSASHLTLSQQHLEQIARSDSDLLYGLSKTQPYIVQPLAMSCA